jgi:phosphatidylglycerol:prolipoprotein diacylglycerol transferase
MFPMLFQVGPFVVYTHDFFTLAGLLAGLALYYYELQRRNMLSYQIFWISLAAIFGGGLGARLIAILDHPSSLNAIGQESFSYFLTHSGKGIIGGVVGGYLAIVLAKRAFHYTHSTGDCYALAIPLGMAIGRVGCFLSELPLGKPTDLPWGITVSESAAQHFEYCPYCNQRMHPSMLYEIAFHMIAFALILRFRHRVMVQGDTLKLYLLAAVVFRFLVEFVRANPEKFWGLTSAQAALIPLTIPLIIYFVRNWRRGVYRMPPVPGRPARIQHQGSTALMADETRATL